MPVTNYHSCNGRILGETTAGVRTDYLTDALGSVTATVNSSQAIVNTYRYKPYGDQLAKTGAGADPRITWAGLARSPVSDYLQSGHNCWHTTLALQSPATSTSRNHGRFNPCALNDADAISVRVSSAVGPECGNCGKFRYSRHFDTTVLKNRKGWLIQEMEIKQASTKEYCQTPPINRSAHYWEAWYWDGTELVDEAQNMVPPYYADIWFMRFENKCTDGGGSHEGWAVFYPIPKECKTIFDGPIPGPWRGFLRGSEDPEWAKKNGFNREKGWHQRIEYTWECPETPGCNCKKCDARTTSMVKPYECKGRMIG